MKKDPIDQNEQARLEEDEKKMKLLFDTHTIQMPQLKYVVTYKEKPVYSFFKRAFDIFCSSLGILVFSWLFLIIALIIKISDRGPIFFVQKRVGKDGKKFKMYKFRSMIPNADVRVVELIGKNESSGPLFKIKDDPRITKIGKFLRKTSLDELPQLFNVFLGSMSLVGPRPALPREVTQYDITETVRLLVKPGITCLWQIKGRSTIGFEGQVALDKEYVEKRSFFLDLKILVLTIPAVFTQKGAE